MFILLAICVLIVPRQVLSAKQQYKYYNPFPPGNDQVMYEFSPVPDKGFHDDRSQKNSDWKEYLAYMNGEVRHFQIKLHSLAWRIIEFQIFLIGWTVV